MNKSIGFIGVGNMGTPMIRSIVASGLLPATKIFINDIDKVKADKLSKELGVIALASNEEVVEKSDIIILAVKPNAIRQVLEPCKNKFSSNKILVSIAVGVPIKLYKEILGSDKKIVRTMPNTPALVGEGMTIVSYDSSAGAEVAGTAGAIEADEAAFITQLFECLGKVELLDEKLMNEVTALTGSSPAYVYIFIEAMADAAVLSGIPRNLAYKLAAQTVLGSAKMVLESGKHPGELKDQVCSPAGTTIAAVSSLEKNGFRSAIIEAMDDCTKRAREIGKIYG